MTLVERLRGHYYVSGTTDTDELVREAADRIAALEAGLREARRWIGDGDLSDGLARAYWTPQYAAAVDSIDQCLTAERELRQ